MRYVSRRDGISPQPSPQGEGAAKPLREYTSVSLSVFLVNLNVIKT